jgi:hypothetical protein
MIFAHVGALPLEELLSLAPAAGAFWLALRGFSAGRRSGGKRPATRTRAI